MTFDYFLILLPVLLAVGALVRVLTLKSPTYHRKRKGDTASSIPGGGDDVNINITHTTSVSRNKQDNDVSDSTSSVGESGGGGD